MKEFEHSEQPKLLPETQELIEKIHTLTGFTVEIQAEPKLHGSARAVLDLARLSSDRCHRVLYDPKFERFLDHHVAHECGHIVRLMTVDENEQVVSVVTRASRKIAVQQLFSNIKGPFDDKNMNEDYWEAISSAWITGIVMQLHNTPPDIHIERWIHQEHPPLRKIQAASILSMARDCHKVLKPRVKLATPPLIWDASNAMNYAILRSAAELYGRDDFIKPYEGTKAEIMGMELFEMFGSTPDTGFACDKQLSDQWADRLGLKNWYIWRNIRDLPVGAKHMWE